MYAQRKQHINACLLKAFVHDKTPKTKNTLLLQTMLSIGREMHDELDSMSGLGDRRKITDIIKKFVNKIDFGKDLEQQLNAYVDFRAIFSNMEDVKTQLIFKVCLLLENALQRVQIMKEKGEDDNIEETLNPFMKGTIYNTNTNKYTI